MTSFNVMIFSLWNLLSITLSLLYKQIARNFVYTCLFGINFKMECKNEHFRDILLFYFRKGMNSAQAAKKSRDVNQTINSDFYCRQLKKLNATVKEKQSELVNRKGVIFHYDNATPYTSLATCQKLLRLGWEMMLYPPYSPDLAPSDYYLFQSLQNSLNCKIFNLRDFHTGLLHFDLQAMR